jgi:proteasome accessory factor C
MHAVEVVDETRDHDDLSPRDLAEGLFEPGPDDIEAVIRLERWARWVADYYPVVATEELGEGRLEVTLRVGDPRWLVRLALRVAPALTIVSPAPLQQEVIDTAASALRLYDGVGTGGVR